MEYVICTDGYEVVISLEALEEITFDAATRVAVARYTSEAGGGGEVFRNVVRWFLQGDCGE